MAWINGQWVDDDELQGMLSPRTQPTWGGSNTLPFYNQPSFTSPLSTLNQEATGISGMFDVPLGQAPTDTVPTLSPATGINMPTYIQGYSPPVGTQEDIDTMMAPFPVSQTVTPTGDDVAFGPQGVGGFKYSRPSPLPVLPTLPGGYISPSDYGKNKALEGFYMTPGALSPGPKSISLLDSQVDPTATDANIQNMMAGGEYGGSGYVSPVTEKPTYSGVAPDWTAGPYSPLFENLGVGWTIGHGMRAKQGGYAPEDYRVEVPATEKDLRSLMEAKLDPSSSAYMTTDEYTGVPTLSELAAGSRASITGKQNIDIAELLSGVTGGSIEVTSPQYGEQHGDQVTATDISEFRPDLYGHHPSALGVGDFVASKMAPFTTVRQGVVPFDMGLGSPVSAAVPRSIDVLPGPQESWSALPYSDISVGRQAIEERNKQAKIDKATEVQIAKDLAMADEQQRYVASTVPSISVPSAAPQQNVINAQMVQEMVARQRQQQSAVDTQRAVGPSQAEIAAQVAQAAQASAAAEAQAARGRVAAAQEVQRFMASRAYQEEGADLTPAMRDALAAGQVDTFADIGGWAGRSPGAAIDVSDRGGGPF